MGSTFSAISREVPMFPTGSRKRESHPARCFSSPESPPKEHGRMIYLLICPAPSIWVCLLLRAPLFFVVSKQNPKQHRPKNGGPPEKLSKCRIFCRSPPPREKKKKDQLPPISQVPFPPPPPPPPAPPKKRTKVKKWFFPKRTKSIFHVPGSRVRVLFRWSARRSRGPKSRTSRPNPAGFPPCRWVFFLVAAF